MNKRQLELHQRLVARQSDEELKRKADKAVCYKSKLWTQEELDEADRKAERLYVSLNWNEKGER